MHPVVRFVAASLGIYIAWIFLYDLWLHPDGRLDHLVIRNSIVLSRSVLEFLGFDTYSEPRIIGITGGGGVWIGDSCNGVTLMALFTGFVLVFPGSWIKRAWFIPIGNMFIHLLNIGRIISLTLLEYYAPEWLEFNHTYTFTFVMYALIFGGWMLWVMLNKTEHVVPISARS